MKNNDTSQKNSALRQLSSKLWIYTNYNCNLSCAYCVAESHPRAPKRRISLEMVKKIVDEATDLGFESLYFTGGEPFILDEIYEMLAYASDHLTTTVLTNAMLFNEPRFQRLVKIRHPKLIVQVSLDGSQPEQHDPYRGQGSFDKTITGLRKLLDHGFRIRLSTTETPTNTDFMDEICEFRRALGIKDEDHFIRPLAKRGFSAQGMEVGKHNLVPEMTINTEGVYWHPLSTDPDLKVTSEIFPLATAVSQINAEVKKISTSQNGDMEEFQ